jgi:GNAT superfamily N-acetyltransferase
MSAEPEIRELLPPETGLAFEAGTSTPSAVAGFRTARGHARALLEWLIEEGKRLGCDQLHLDSGVGIDRAAAYRLYLNAGLVISAHHFARYVD